MNRLYTKLTILLIFFLLISFSTLFAQPNQWTWEKGDNVVHVAGIYGVQGVGADNNKPGGRQGSVTWTDAAGNLWLFGGYGDRLDFFTNVHFNDLWKYNPATHQWTWVKGDSTINSVGVYGSQGVPGPANTPGSRFGSVGWTDNSGNFWLFGGTVQATTGTKQFNDLWKYNIAANEWSWISGDSVPGMSGNYGLQGIPAPSNKPGARDMSVGWADASGNLWLFGGEGLFSPPRFEIKYLNDLWKYNIAANEWTWVSGDSTANNPGIYGTRRIAAAGNKPGGRYLGSSWTDVSGNLWLFGGSGYASQNPGALNDLWKYDATTNQWTWIKGDSIPSVYGIYGIRGNPSVVNKPGSRSGCVGWTDSSGKLWLFGGYGNGAGFNSSGGLNDLWRYNIATEEWTWVKGDTVAFIHGVYGVQGIAANENKPGSRSVSSTWRDVDGNFWLFGGQAWTASAANYNDLWKYNVSYSLSVPSVTIINPMNNSVFAGGDTITVSASATETNGGIRKVEFYNYTTKIFEDATAPYEVRSNQGEPDNYAITARAIDSNGATAVSDTVRITITGCIPAGTILGEGYTNIPGTQVADLSSNAAYPDSPSITAQLNIFEYVNIGDNYGGRLRGYICAPLTGNYTFYIAGDDQAGLFLSTDANPVNKVLIAYNLTPVGFRNWTTFSTQRSNPVRLIKGTRYYIESLHKESTGTDHLSVGWVLPNGVAERPIPGSRLSSWQNDFAAHSTGLNFAESMKAVNKKVALIQGLTISATPNPSQNYFTLTTTSNEKMSLILTVTDVLGRVVEKRMNLAANGTIRFGSTLHAGIYFAEVIQGSTKKIIKLIKQ